MSRKRNNLIKKKTDAVTCAALFEEKIWLFHFVNILCALLFRSSLFGEKASRVSPYKEFSQQSTKEHDVPTFNTDTSNLEQSVAPRGHGFSPFRWPKDEGGYMW